MMVSHTTKIAIDQDALIATYKSGKTTMPSSQLRDMQRDLWIRTSSVLAPNNLVIRQYCLIDIFSNSVKNKSKIKSQLDSLSYTSYNLDKRIWAEGYSYWLYVREALDLWIDKFKRTTNLTDVQSLISDVDFGFQSTAYLRNGIFYPAPFGDLRDQPLHESLQASHVMKSARCKIVSFCAGATVKYYIKANPVGLNTHVPKNDSTITIVDGIPKPFTFYHGYDKKYDNTFCEITDTISFQRVMSLFF
jgi:hypothetical protein